LRVWDAAGGQEANLLSINTPNEVSTLAYAPGGRLLAWGDLAGRTGIVDTRLNKEVFRKLAPALKGQDPIAEFAFRPDGLQVAWRRFSGATTLRDLEKNETIPLVDADKGKFLALAFSADGKQLLAAQRNPETLALRDLRTGQVLQTLPLLSKSVARVAWSPRAERLVVVGDSTLEVWDVPAGQRHIEAKHQLGVTCVAFSEDGRFLAMGGAAGKISVWNLIEKRETMSVTGHSSNLHGLVLSPDGRRLASSAADCTVKLWDTQTRHEVLTLRTQLHEHSPLAFSPDGADLAGVTGDNQLQIWSTRNPGQPP
jgi:WD40 repeat protein